METIKKRFRSLAEAQCFQELLNLTYRKVVLVKSPFICESGDYWWRVR